MTLEVADLAQHIVRRLPRDVGFEDAGVSLARELNRCAEDVPPDAHLVLGGSLARGEPSIRVARQGFELISDIDLLLVHDSLLPPFTTADFVRRHESRLPTITLMSVSAREYQILETSLGYDFKDGGVVLTPHPLRSPTVQTDHRDAFEVFVFAILLALLDGLLTLPAKGDSHEAASRVLGKVIRSVGLLEGVNAQHDVVTIDPTLALCHRQQIDLLHDPDKLPVQATPDVICSALAAGLALHDAAAGRQRRDAIEHSKYQRRPGADFVQHAQRVLVQILRLTIAEGAALTDPRATSQARAAAWKTLVHDGIARPQVSPEEYSRSILGLFRQALLDMKVRTGDGDTRSAG